MLGALEDLDGDVTYALKLREQLESKLKGVLKNSSPVADAAGLASQPPRDISSVTSEVEGIDNKVRGLNRSLEDLLARIDM